MNTTVLSCLVLLLTGSPLNARAQEKERAPATAPAPAKKQQEIKFKAWESEGRNEYYFREFSLKKAYPMGINIVVYALTIFSSAVVGAAAEGEGRPNLTGTVQDGTGKPLSDATVFIYTA